MEHERADGLSMDVLYRFPTPRQAPGESSDRKGPGRWRRTRVLMLMVAGAFLAGLAFKAVSDARKDEVPTASVLDIRTLVIKTALHRPLDTSQPSGGVLGPWWIHATTSDNWDLHGLCLEGSDAHVAASKARIIINAVDDSLCFQLEDAVIVTLPDSDHEGTIERHDSIMLGPVPMSIDVLSEADAIESVQS